MKWLDRLKRLFRREPRYLMLRTGDPTAARSANREGKTAVVLTPFTAPPYGPIRGFELRRSEDGLIIAQGHIPGSYAAGDTVSVNLGKISLD